MGDASDNSSFCRHKDGAVMHGDRQAAGDQQDICGLYAEKGRTVSVICASVREPSADVASPKISGRGWQSQRSGNRQAAAQVLKFLEFKTRHLADGRQGQSEGGGPRVRSQTSSQNRRRVYSRRPVFFNIPGSPVRQKRLHMGRNIKNIFKVPGGA